MAGLVVLDLGFSALIDRNTSPDYRQTVASKSDFQESKPYDVWIIGDSLAVDGVAPSVIRQETGRTTYDWGLYASSPFEWNILLRDLEHRSPFPPTVVIVCHPNMFIKRPNDGPFARAAIKTPGLQFSLMAGSVERADLSALLASGQRRLMLKGALAMSARRSRGEPASAAESDNGHLVHRTGLNVIPHLMFDALKFDEKNSKFQADAFEDLVRRCSTRGAEVVFAKIAVSEPQLQDYKKDVPTFEHYEQVLDRVSRQYGARVYESQTDEVCESYSPSDFTDAIHLSQQGAVKFTTGLARWLGVRSR
ncbi:MAG: hypothetical protein ABI837_21185 [Acidobacteriota bacterium]